MNFAGALRPDPSEGHGAQGGSKAPRSGGSGATRSLLLKQASMAGAHLLTRPSTVAFRAPDNEPGDDGRGVPPRDNGDRPHPENVDSAPCAMLGAAPTQERGRPRNFRNP